MKLPKRDLPHYSVTLPYSGRTTTYRPYTVKEERILSMAAQTEDKKTIVDAMKQIVENCTDEKFENLTDADFEFLYLKLVSVSVSNVSSVPLSLDCGKPECPREHPTAVNLDHVKVNGIEQMQANGAYRKKDYWVIPFDETSGICMRLVLSEDDPDETLFKSTVNIFDADGVYDEFTKEELIDFIECLKPDEFAKIRDFVANQPYCSIEVDGRCKACGKTIKLETKGVMNFLE